MGAWLGQGVIHDVDRVDPRGALEPATYRLNPPCDRDRCGVWRATGLAVALLGSGAVYQARNDKRLGNWERPIAVAVGAGYAGLGTLALVRRPWFARNVIRHPRRALGIAALPTIAASFSGRAHTPLHTLAAVSAGASAIIYGRRTGRKAAALTAGFWSAQALTNWRPRSGQPWPWVFLVIPLTHVADARIFATLASFAYNARSVDSALQDLTSDRDALRIGCAELDARLQRAEKSILGPLAARHPDALSGFGRLQEARGALAAAGVPAPSRGLMRRVYEAVRRLCHGDGIRSGQLSSIPSRPLTEICRDEIAASRPALRSGVQVKVIPTVVDRVRVHGAERIALAAAVVAAGVINASRHSPEVTQILINATVADEGGLVIEIENDGTARDAGLAPVFSTGLQALRKELELIDGTLAAIRPTAGRYRLTATFPPVPGPLDEDDERVMFDWHEVEGKLDATLKAAVACMTAMVAAGLAVAPPPKRAPRRVFASAVLTAAVPLAYHLGERRGHHQGKITGLVPLLAAAAVGAVNTDPHRGIFCGWSSAALARYALHNGSLYGLPALIGNAAAIRWAYRGKPDRTRMPAQLMILCATAVGAMAVMVPAIRGLRGREERIAAALSSIEIADGIALSLHGSHSCIDPIERLAANPAAASEADRVSMARAVSSVRWLTGKRVATPDLLVGQLVSDVVTVIGRRAFPATVTIEDVDMTHLGRSAQGRRLHRTSVRLAVLAAADLVAREALLQQPVRFDGNRPLSNLKVRVAGRYDNDAIDFTVSPVPHSGKERERETKRQLYDLGASLASWTADGQLTFAVYA